jgi:NSS family neurotransmitter:Na+ symporter
MAEFAIGKESRFGTIGAFATMMGKKMAWMGAFVGFVATAIMFYYSVVAGWCIRYFSLAATGQLLAVSDHEQFWADFVGTGWQPVLFHIVATTIGVLIVRRGVVSGIEKANRFLIPALLLLIVVSAVRAVTLPGAIKGLEYLFTPDLNSLTDAGVWLNALTQNAWDTGAGWGLILTYAVYMRRREDIPLNAALIGLGNNSVSLLAAITIFSTVFAVIPLQAQEVIQSAGPANTGLTFIWIPQLFGQMPGGSLFAAFFFLALTFAAISSLISMIELATRILIDLKMERAKALRIVYCVTLIMGIPSALSVDYFLNQDWTWGVGLMLSGFFIALLVIRQNVDQFRRKLINSEGSDIKVGRWYNILLRYAIPAQVVILVSWWFYQVIKADPANWWNPFSTESVGTCIAQWGLVILVLIIFNKPIAERTLRR